MHSTMLLSCEVRQKITVMPSWNSVNQSLSDKSLSAATIWIENLINNVELVFILLYSHISLPEANSPQSFILLQLLLHLDPALRNLVVLSSMNSRYLILSFILFLQLWAHDCNTLLDKGEK